MSTPMRPYQIIGAFDAYGATRWKVIYREADGSLSQGYPGHYDEIGALWHKKWRWWVDEKRLDGPELMHWTPDVEEMDRIDRIVASQLKSTYDTPRYSMDGKYPNWPRVYDPHKSR